MGWDEVRLEMSSYRHAGVYLMYSLGVLECGCMGRWRVSNVDEAVGISSTLDHRRQPNGCIACLLQGALSMTSANHNAGRYCFFLPCSA